MGTVNDAYKPPSPEHYEGSYHWTYERAISITMIPLVMTPFVAGVEFPMIDSIFSTFIVVSLSCWDEVMYNRLYTKKSIWVLVRCCCKLLTLGTFVAIYGIYVLETTSNGLFNLVSSLWAA